MGRVDIERFPENQVARRMLKRVSSMYNSSYVGKWIFEIMGTEMDEAWQHVRALREQAFVETVTWGIEYWEHRYSIQPDERLTIEERRRRIKAKRNKRYPLNPAKLEKIIYELWNQKAEVTENIAPYTFMLELLDEDYTNFNEIVKEVRRIKPSHLSLEMLLQFYLKWRIHHRAECEQVVAAYQKFWNLGSVRSVRRDGEFLRDGVIRRTGKHPIGQYREKQAHRLEVDMQVNAAMNGSRVVNRRDGTHCRDGSHRRNGAYETGGMVSHCCTVTYMKNGIEVIEYV